MVNAVLLFEAYLNAAIPYIDMKWLADPIVHTFALLVKNQSNQSLYFKLFNAIPNWDFGTSLPGSDENALGAISAGSSKLFMIDMVREVPVGETYDGGNLTLKAYTDAGYTNEIASDELYATIDIQDIENWTDVAISDFDDGTAQGWSLSGFGVSNSKSVEVGGYSLLFQSPTSDFQVVWTTAYAQKSVDIPNRNKCSLGFFLTWINGGIDYLRVKVLLNSIEILSWYKTFPVDGVDIWEKFVANLSPYKGQSKTIKIELYVAQRRYATPGAKYWLDRIVIAGKD